jgi:hypothetical protein
LQAGDHYHRRTPDLRLVESVGVSQVRMSVRSSYLAWLCVIAGVAAYFGTASWLERSWEDPRPEGLVVAQLVPPFVPLGKAAFRATPLSEFDGLGILADCPDIEGDARSPLVVYEDGKQLGPSHSSFADVSAGHGHYAHWSGIGVVFSSSDGTDPNTNGRHYWAVVATQGEVAARIASTIKCAGPSPAGPATSSSGNPIGPHGSS